MPFASLSSPRLASIVQNLLVSRPPQLSVRGLQESYHQTVDFGENPVCVRIFRSSSRSVSPSGPRGRSGVSTVKANHLHGGLETADAPSGRDRVVALHENHLQLSCLTVLSYRPRRASVHGRIRSGRRWQGPRVPPVAPSIRLHERKLAEPAKTSKSLRGAHGSYLIWMMLPPLSLIPMIFWCFESSTASRSRRC